MKILKHIFIFTVLLFFSVISFSQDNDLLNILDKQVSDTILPVTAVFKATRIINGHSTTLVGKKQLDFRINHRFGQLNSGLYEMFGLDNALINLSFDYGITDRIMVGIRRGTNKKTVDGMIKTSIIRQSTGRRNIPVTICYMGDVSLKTIRGYMDLPDLKDGSFDELSHRLAFTHQLLISRKFNEALSLQLSPTFVHRNIVLPNENNDIWALGFSGRYKFARRVAFTFEYFYSNLVSKTNDYQYPLSLGFDIETGGHVFQLFVTNSRAMVEDAVFGETTGNWLKGGIYFGFNLSRIFAL